LTLYISSTLSHHLEEKDGWTKRKKLEWPGRRDRARRQEGERAKKGIGGKTYISVAAPTASSTPPNPTTAHLVGKSGASLNVASVTIPRVPSAPMKSLVISGPAADLRALERVLMISPEGRTTV
jgi:hypothetical protein